MFDTQRSFDAAEAIAHGRDMFLLNEVLLLQPCQRCELVIQVVRLQETDQGGNSGGNATDLHGRRDFVADGRTG
jgi:hypothetical protein